MAKVAEGVYQLLTPFPQYSLEEAKFLRVDLEASPRIIKGLPYVMPYLLQSRGETALIDCGWNTDEAYGALEEAMGEAGTHPSDIQKLLITHVHADHYGMSGRLKELTDCTVIVHEKDAEVVRDRYIAPEKLAAQQAQFLMLHGMPPAEGPIQAHSPAPGRDRPVWPATPDQVVQGGETLKVGDFDLQVIWTPGHSPGHICFYEPNRKILFTGDHILPTITPNVSMHIQSHGSPLADYSRSLDIVNDLDVEHVFPATSSTSGTSRSGSPRSTTTTRSAWKRCTGASNREARPPTKSLRGSNGPPGRWRPSTPSSSAPPPGKPSPTSNTCSRMDGSPRYGAATSSTGCPCSHPASPSRYTSADDRHDTDG